MLPDQSHEMKYFIQRHQYAKSTFPAVAVQLAFFDIVFLLVATIYKTSLFLVSLTMHEQYNASL